MRYFCCSLVLLLVAFGCTTEERETPSANPAIFKVRPNLLLITLDTVRADRLGIYGYESASTPALDSLAMAGMRFEWAICPTPLTLPSHATLLTGVYPPEHGLHSNLSGALGEEIETLAKVVSRQNYRTAAFISAFVLDARFGLAQGFEVYNDDLSETTAARNEVAEVPGNVVTDRALEWLEDESGSPFFCWVHLYDAHAPYQPPEAFRSRFDDPYDGELSFADSQVGRLIAWLDENSLRSRTLVVVVGDHGESLGDHGEDQHGFFIYNSTIRVPLIFSWPEQIRANSVVSQVVGMVDVFPTITDLLQVEGPRNISGQSLLPLMRGESLETPSVYSETEVPLEEYNWSPLYSLISSPWKYIDSPSPELYDLVEDPGESMNLIAQHMNVARRMKKQLNQLTESITPREVGKTTLDQAAVERLRALGYVQGRTKRSNGKRRPSGPLKTPKGMIDIFRAAKKGQRAIRREDYETAAKVLQPAAKLSPESVRIRFDLASAYFELKRYRECVSEYEAGLELNPDNADAHGRLGVALDKLGKTEKGIRHLRHAIRIRANNGDASYNLADILAREGRVDEAMVFLKKATRIRPDAKQSRFPEEMVKLRVKTLTNVAAALTAQGRFDESIPMLREALTIDPDFAEAENNLGAALLNQGDLKKAVAHFRRAIELEAGSVEVHHNLAMALARMERNDEAVVHFLKVLRLRPEDVEAHNNVGILLSREGKLKEAIVHLSEALRLRPNDVQTHTNLGIALAKQGKIEDAIAHLTEALRIDPDFDPARESLQIVRQHQRAGGVPGTQP